MLRFLLSIMVIAVWALSWARCTAERSGVMLEPSLHCCCEQTAAHAAADSHAPNQSEEKGCLLCSVLDAIVLPAPLLLIAIAAVWIVSALLPALQFLLAGSSLPAKVLRRPPPDDGVGFSEWLLDRACPVRGPSMA